MSFREFTLLVLLLESNNYFFVMLPEIIIWMKNSVSTYVQKAHIANCSHIPSPKDPSQESNKTCIPTSDWRNINKLFNWARRPQCKREKKIMKTMLFRNRRLSLPYYMQERLNKMAVPLWSLLKRVRICAQSLTPISVSGGVRKHLKFIKKVYFQEIGLPAVFITKREIYT